MTIGIGVIGYGYWGPNLARNIRETEHARLVAICDHSEDRLALAARSYPEAVLTNDIEPLLARGDIDAVAIATPVDSHFSIARTALEAGKHVLIEKPMAASSEQCRFLNALAAKNNLVLAVDHTFLFTGAVGKMRELISSNILGNVFYYDSIRINLGLIQSDVSVLWDLAVHDLSILLYIMPKRPVSISAQGSSFFRGSPHSVAFMTLFYTDDTIAHVNVNWLSPVKVRQTLIGGTDKMILYNDLHPSEKISVYDRGVDVCMSPEEVRRILVSYRVGDVWIPKISMREALAVEIEEFAQAVERGKDFRSKGDLGFEVVQILEAATESVAENGRPIDLPKLEIPRASE